ncbi:MAG: hypothetical protein U0798_07260 [Gemmataceae bacterium]
MKRMKMGSPAWEDEDDVIQINLLRKGQESTPHRTIFSTKFRESINPATFRPASKSFPTTTARQGSDRKTDRHFGRGNPLRQWPRPPAIPSARRTPLQDDVATTSARLPGAWLLSRKPLQPAIDQRGLIGNTSLISVITVARSPQRPSRNGRRTIDHLILMHVLGHRCSSW